MRLINNNALLCCVIGSFIVSANASGTSSLRGSSITAATERRLADTIQCVNTLVADVQYADIITMKHASIVNSKMVSPTHSICPMKM